MSTYENDKAIQAREYKSFVMGYDREAILKAAKAKQDAEIEAGNLVQADGFVIDYRWA